MISVAPYVQIVLLLVAVLVLIDIHRYVQRFDRYLWDLHIAVALKEDPKKYGGGKVKILD